MAISLSLCLRAQAQSLKARDDIPRHDKRYSMTAPPVSVMRPARHAFSDIVSRRVYSPEDGEMLYSVWHNADHRLA